MFTLIPIESYISVYYVIVMFFVLSQLLYTYNYDRNSMQVKTYNLYSSNILLLFTLMMIGMRPLSGIFTDMYTYSFIFEAITFDELGNDRLFGLYMYLCKQVATVEFLFFLTACIYIGCLYKASVRLSNKYRFVVFLMFVTSFSFFAYGTNTIRAGMAGSILILGLTYINKLKIAIPIFFIGIGIHTSMLLPAAAFGLAYFYRNTKHYIYIWFACILLSFVLGGVMEQFFASIGFSDERLSGYLIVEETEYKVGFRWDFLLYSALPIVMGWYVIVKRGITQPFYVILLNAYIISNAFWVLIIRANFSDRFAYLSWFMMPLVIIYPVLKFRLWSRQYIKAAFIVFLNFMFTYLMFLRN